MNVMASVRDKHNTLVPTLTKDDFEIFENGKPQEIKYLLARIEFAAHDRTSGGCEPEPGELNWHRAARRGCVFGRGAPGERRGFLLSFGADTEMCRILRAQSDAPARPGESEAEFGFSGITAGPVPTATHQAGTVLYDAIYLGANDRLAREAGRKVLVVITDGDDEGSQVSIKKAIESAQKADITIYSIYYVDPYFYARGGGFSFGGGGRGYLQQMSSETGGHVYEVSRRNTLDKVFDELQQEMRTQYAIAYTSTDPKKDGSYHKLEIKTKDKDLKVQARKGYYAMPDEKQ